MTTRRWQVLLACIGALLGPRALQAQQATPLRGFAAAPDVRMRIFVPTGRVRVGVWDRDSIAISGTIGKASSMFGGGTRAYVKFGVEPLRTGDSKLAEADWVVTIPRKAHLWVKLTNGEIETDGTSGETELYAIGGRITVRRASGVVSVESIDAAVTLDDVSGDVRVRGGKAAVVLRNVRGTASVATISGRVSIAGTRAPDCRVETIGGDIEIDAVPDGVTWELQTHSGAIALRLDAARLPLLELTTRSGVLQWDKRGGDARNGRVVARSFKGAISVGYRAK